jgi:hypothetical protein
MPALAGLGAAQDQGDSGKMHGRVAGL